MQNNIIDSIQLSGVTYQIQGSGGGGKAIEAGRGISITTGETADTVSFDLPISAGTGTNTLILNYSGNTANGEHSVAEGYQTSATTASHAEGYDTGALALGSHAEGCATKANGLYSHAEGYATKANGNYSHAENRSTANGQYSHAEGLTETKNHVEHASGQYNNSVSASTTFGDSGNTLFSVGNGTAASARHNAFEIRQNGDIYLSSGGTDIKLQDHLGGGGTVDQTIISGSTNAVAGGAVYNKIDEIEEVTAAGLNALNDKITPTVELTQAQYDALVDKDPNTYYIITDAQAGDLTNYYTKSETNTLLGGKQATLVSGTNIKTINNESLLGSGNIDIQGGGGKAIEAGRGISITTGATADTVSFDLPISATTNGSILIGVSCSANREKSFVGGQGSVGQSEGSFAFGQYCKASQWSIAVGDHIEANITPNSAAFGKYNKQNGGFYEADSATTLFSVGNGNGASARHNAFEIRKNGDIYLSLNGQDVKLQDQLGGSSITVDSALSSTSENPVQNKVIYNKIDEVEQVTAAGLNTLNESLSGKQDTLSAGTNITISGNVISAEGGGLTEDDELLLSTALTDLNDRKIDASEVKSNYQRKGDYVTTNTLNTRLAEYETKENVEQVEKITAYALNDLNQRFGGLKITKITESEYAALTTKDENTLYIVIADPS